MFIYITIKKLKIEDYTERLEINPLRSLKKIELLNIDEYFDVSDIKELLTFRKLEHIRKLRINKCDNLTVLCEYLKDTGIQNLIIGNLSNTKTLLPIKNLNNLTKEELRVEDDGINERENKTQYEVCLLYTSDAADE